MWTSTPRSEWGVLLLVYFARSIKKYITIIKHTLIPQLSGESNKSASTIEQQCMYRVFQKELIICCGGEGGVCSDVSFIRLNLINSSSLYCTYRLFL